MDLTKNVDCVAVSPSRVELSLLCRQGCRITHAMLLDNLAPFPKRRSTESESLGLRGSCCIKSIRGRAVENLGYVCRITHAMLLRPLKS